MEKILKMLPAGVEAEVYYTEATDQSASYSAGALKGIESRTLGGYALRVIVDGKIGFATTTHHSQFPWLIESALATARLGRLTQLSWPTAQIGSLPVDEELMSFSEAKLKAQAEELAGLVQAHNPDFLVRAGATLVKERTQVMNTAGAAGESQRARLSVSCGAELVSGQDILNVYTGTSTGRLADLRAAALVEGVFGPLGQATEVVPAVSGPQPVLLTSKALSGTIIYPLLAAFSGKNVSQGTSPLASRVGEQLFDSKLSIIDDATLPYTPSSSAIDDEGVPTRRFPLIEAGVVKGFVYDLQTAAKAGVESTGHGRKIGRTSGARLNSLPAPGMSNVYMSPGEASFAELLAAVGDGVIVDQISGTPGFNPSGDFSVTIQLGYLVRNGQIVGRIKNAMLSGNAFAALRDLKLIGQEARWAGGGESGALSVPPVVIGSMNIIAR